jgi:TPP-dependent pyruvate/acetoin dehydrogenase alpha subunit
MTYRWREHVGPYFDHELNRTYRTQEEVQGWMDRCPIKRSEERLVEWGVATREQLADWHRATKAEVVADVERARKAPWPRVETLFEFV